jgi:hypothetical protein
MEILLVAHIGVALDIISPIKHGTEPFGLVVLAHGFRVFADVNSSLNQAGDLLDDLTIEESIVVRSSSLNSSTTPPAAAGSYCPRCTFERT